MYNKPDRFERIHIRPAIAIMALWALMFVSCGDGPTEPPGDTTPPTVAATEPEAGATDVAVDGNIMVTFSERIASASVSGATFQVAPSLSGSFVVDSNQITLNPTNDLAYNTGYSITLTTGIKDLAGNGLDDDTSWSFTTALDPDSIPPVLISTDPINGVMNVPVGASISATFSKGMASGTFNTASFSINNGVTGTVSVVGNVATYTPDSDLAYATTYQAAISTSVTDTFGVHLQSRETWTFITEQDPLSPVVGIDWPFNYAIIDDTVTIAVTATHPVGVDSVQFSLDGARIGVDVDEPFSFLFDASALEVGSIHGIVARAYDSEDRVGISQAVAVYYLWEEMATDGNFEELELDIRRLLARTTDSVLEIRCEFSADWSDPINDTALDMGIFVDTDQNQLTGRTDFDQKTLNDIGAEYRILIGMHGDTALAVWNSGTERWDFVFHPDGLSYITLPYDDRVYEFGIRWSDLNDAGAVDIVGINLFWQSTDAYVPDWIPDRDQGHITINRSNRWIGEGPTAAPGVPAQRYPQATTLRDNRFNR